MRVPPGVEEQVPVVGRLLDCCCVQGIALLPPLAQVRKAVEELRYARGLAVLTGPGEGVDEDRGRDGADSEVEGCLCWGCQCSEVRYRNTAFLVSMQ